jgi:transcriptional regulator with PAS, ATPase and Fis domain
MSRDQIKQRFSIVGNTPKLNSAIDIAIQVAPTEVTVLVVGENGTGKDVFSRIIHQQSIRKHKQFIAINCGAIPEGTIDSELFGHEKGSFTSAYDSRKGYFEEVNGGVIFLDEIAEMPLATQARLLRVLENGEYLRVGSSKVLKTDVRVIAATNKNLIELIRQNKFREDLYFRLNTVTIQVPPLRERGEDIELLFRYFAYEFGDRYHRAPIQLTPDAVPILYNYHWPGNIREIRNFVEKLTVLVPAQLITAAILQEHIPSSDSLLPVLAMPARHRMEEENINHQYFQHNRAYSGTEYEVLLKAMLEMRSEMSEIKTALATLIQHQFQSGNTTAISPAYGNVVYKPVFSAERAPEPIEMDLEEADTAILPAGDNFSLESQEKELIVRALSKYHQNRKKAAHELGISERTLYRKIRIYGIDTK